jgi:hypothetical protein
MGRTSSRMSKTRKKEGRGGVSSRWAVLANLRYDVRCDGRGCAAEHLVLIPFQNRDLRTSAHGARAHLKHDPPAPESWPAISTGGLAAVLLRRFYSLEPCKANMKHGFRTGRARLANVLVLFSLCCSLHLV